ncbi:MAG: universal stress protein [Chloroflexi bacterium]|nr:universal stress protein [Chloroflexota bacterium]MBV9601635.1 universal stress protein [Chloroflexota bacterium]
MFSHILVPLDGTAESTVAVTQACAIAGLSGARVTLLRVYSGGTPTPETMEYLHKAALECGNASVETDVAVLSGDPTDVILEQLEARGADLVIMRTRGRAGLSRAVLGSVAEGIVKRSPSPVLLLPPQADAATLVRTILVPVDGSPGGALALGAARLLALKTGARLSLRQIVVPASTYFVHAAATQGALYIDPRWDEDAVSAARAYIDSLKEHVSADGVQCDGEVLVEDRVADAIVGSATEQRADLIVMSSVAHTGAARAILGSVTDAVVRTATRPVLVLRQDAA